MLLKKPSIWIIFLTVFVDLVGFGIVIPLLPIYAKSYHAGGLEIGILVGTFSLMQFLCAPWLGRLSDKIGRKPVLMRSTAGAAISYAIFAISSGYPGGVALALLFLSRTVAGICGGNVAVAQAYIADITPPEKRSRSMGVIGMAFGLGFAFGPFIGGEARILFGEMGPGAVAATLCALNFLLTWLILPESWTPQTPKVERRTYFREWLHTIRKPGVGLLISVFFLSTFCFGCFETLLGLLVMEKFSIATDSASGIQKIANVFMMLGLMGAIAQGGLAGRLVRALGESRLITLCLLGMALGLGMMPFIGAWWALYVLLALWAVSASLIRPPVFGMLSNLTRAENQGVTIGVAQSMGSLARILGPVFGGSLFAINIGLPYWLCAVVALLTGIGAHRYLSALKTVPQSA